MPQAIMTGKSIPKVVRVNAGDGEAVLYKNLGDGQRIPFLWSTTVTLASGTTSVVVASGVELGGHKAAAGFVFCTPTLDSSSNAQYYVNKNSTTNIVTLHVSAADASQNITFDVMIFMGNSFSISSTASNQIYKYGSTT